MALPIYIPPNGNPERIIYGNEREAAGYGPIMDALAKRRADKISAKLGQSVTIFVRGVGDSQANVIIDDNPLFKVYFKDGTFLPTKIDTMDGEVVSAIKEAFGTGVTQAEFNDVKAEAEKKAGKLFATATLNPKSLQAGGYRRRKGSRKTHRKGSRKTHRSRKSTRRA